MNFLTIYSQQTSNVAAI